MDIARPNETQTKTEIKFARTRNIGKRTPFASLDIHAVATPSRGVRAELKLNDEELLMLYGVKEDGTNYFTYLAEEAMHTICEDLCSFFDVPANDELRAAFMTKLPLLDFSIKDRTLKWRADVERTAVLSEAILASSPSRH